MNKLSTAGKLQRIYDRHDIECNQKYDGVYPYSLHLKAVRAQVRKYCKIFIKDLDRINSIDPRRYFPTIDSWLSALELAAAGHDLIEDARWTYGDIKHLTSSFVADLIRCCTTPDIAGRDREERHNNVFFVRLEEERWAIFIKLCDIIANVLFSLLTNSGMYGKYQKEFPNLYERLYKKEEFDIVWDDLRELLKM